MKNSAIKIGIVGAGDHSSENIIPAAGGMDGVELLWIADNNVQKADNATRSFKSCKSGANWRELAELHRPDALLAIASPDIHFDVASYALARGIPIFVEKPPCFSTSQLETLAHLASSRNIVTLVGHNLRHTEAALEMRRIAAASTFGPPIGMEMRYFASKPRGTRWGLSDTVTSFLLSHGNHAIDLMIHQMGPLEKVNAALVSSSGDALTLSAQFIFQSGAVGNLLASTATPHFRIAASVIGEHGATAEMVGLTEVKVFGLEDDAKRWGRMWNARTLTTGYEFAGYSAELKAFFDAIRGSDHNGCHPTLADEIAVYKAMDQIELKLRSRE